MSAATGGGFHLTPGDLTLATLVTGLLSAAIVSFFQTRGKRDSTGDKTLDYTIERLRDAEEQIHDLRQELEEKQELIDEIRQNDED